MRENCGSFHHERYRLQVKPQQYHATDVAVLGRPEDATSAYEAYPRVHELYP
jgi:hypothetical protein